MQRKLTFLAYILICTNCLAQQYPFVYYTPRDGLVNSRVRAIKQDSKGRMLFLTYSGLSIYDGSRFTNYNEQNGLANELVNDLVEMAPDSFLVSTNTPLLNTLVHGKIGVYHTSDNFYPTINRFFKSSEGNWYVIADQGLFLFDKNKFTHMPLFNGQGIDIGLYLDRIIEWKNFFLITTWNPDRKEKLILYDWKNKKVLDIDSKNKVINCAVDKDNCIWITLEKKVALLDTLSILKGKFRFIPIPGKYKNLAQNNSYIFFDHDDDMWFFGQGGIMKISPDLQKLTFTPEQGLKSTNLTDMFIDKEGITWFATDGNGVIKIKNDNLQLLTSLGNSRSLTTLDGRNDTTWISSGYIVYRIYRNEVKFFPLSRKLFFISGLYIDDKKLYALADDKMICIEDKNNPASYRHPVQVFSSASQNMDYGNGLLDKNDFIIQLLKKKDQESYLAVFRKNKLVSEIPIPYMADQLVQDKDGRIWAATRNNHLLVFAVHPDQPSHYLQLQKDFTKELPGMSPRCITIDTAGNIWVGTRYSGIYRFEFDGLQLRSATQFTIQNGLTDNFIYSINCDANNTIWVGTQTGLDKIFRKNGQYITGNISKVNNLFGSVHKIVITGDNTVWAQTEEGILKIVPGLPKNNLPAPQFLITSLQVNNQSRPDPSTSLSHRENNLFFTVAAPSFFDERSINYSYLLEGSNNHNWSRPSNNSAFNFINLSPGHYTLKVRADFPEAMYPSQTINYSFTIEPPWWRTWWFIIVFSVFIIGLLITTIRFYYNRKLERQKVFLEKQQAVEKERTRIATDMHDDLGAGLSRIKFLSETIGIKKQKQLPFEEDISKIREYSHEMIDKMGEIVWALNEKNDSLNDLLSYTRAYTAEYLSQNGIHCTIDEPEQLPASFVSGEFRRNIFLTVKEALHNIVKHSQADAVCIQIKKDKNLTIAIKDNGVGFDEKNIRQFSNGIHNMKKRMNDIKGILEITHQTGTTVKLVAPLL